MLNDVVKFTYQSSNLVHLDEISCPKRRGEKNNVQLILPPKTNTLQIKHEQLILRQNYLNFKIKEDEENKKKIFLQQNTEHDNQINPFS